MPQRLSFLLVGSLISCTVLGAGLDPVRVGRYSALVPGPSPEQADPFALAIHTEFSYTVQTVGHALKQGARTQWLPLSEPRCLLVLRVLDQATAEMLTAKLPEIEVQALRTRSGATDSSVPAIPVDFVSTTLDEVATQRVPLLTPADLISLPKGQAFALLEGGQLWKIRLPLLEDRDDPILPPALATALSEMAKRYTTASGWGT